VVPNVIVRAILVESRRLSSKRCCSLLACSLLCGLFAAPASAADPDYTAVQDWLLLVGGAATGFVMHEAGHLTFDGIAGNDPYLSGVKLGPIPFFAIRPRHISMPRELYGTAMMGFFVEAIYTETIFARQPDLLHHHRPFLEGMLAFHFLLDLGYAITGFAKIGPPESDLNALARGGHVSRLGLASLLALPLVFDFMRYVFPETRSWSMWFGLSARVPLFGAIFVI
jgi:hypothetical protein